MSLEALSDVSVIVAPRGAPVSIILDVLVIFVATRGRPTLPSSPSVCVDNASCWQETADDDDGQHRSESNVRLELNCDADVNQSISTEYPKCICNCQQQLNAKPHQSHITCYTAKSWSFVSSLPCSYPYKGHVSNLKTYDKLLLLFCFCYYYYYYYYKHFVAHGKGHSIKANLRHILAYPQNTDFINPIAPSHLRTGACHLHSVHVCMDAEPEKGYAVWHWRMVLGRHRQRRTERRRFHEVQQALRLVDGVSATPRQLYRPW